jgi:uncharacterized protein YjiS (DUF1127 family)
MYDIQMSRSPAVGAGSPPRTALPRRHAVGAWLVRAVTGLAAAIAREVRVRRAMRDLAMMDEHMLRDIGLTRAEIGHATRFGRRR